MSQAAAEVVGRLEVDATDLVVSDAARAKIAALIRDADDEITAVRVFVSGGGCSGMRYGMTFAESESGRDSVIADGEGGFRLVVDPVAMNYLRGAEIDYVDDGVNQSFVFNNVFESVGGSGTCGGCGGGGY